MSTLEAGMMLCFGAAWPISLIKSWKSRSTGGKSPWFSVVVIVGYLLGILHKLIFSRDLVLILYCINTLMVAGDLCLWFRNRKLEKQTGI